jgi:hypothetical protein
MKGLKLCLVITAAALLTLGFSGFAFAFHAGGAAECSGCHSMHAPKDTSTGHLLIATDQSSTCLDCHERTGDTGPRSYHVSTPESELGAGVPPKQVPPGGDFAWVKKTYTYTERGSTVTEQGSTHGHNIVAADKGYTAVTGTSPGGSYPSSSLGCTSCHDPHGKARRLSDGTFTVPTVGQTYAPIIGSGSYNNSTVPAAGEAVGVYRILAGKNYVTENVTFNTYPIAVAPSTYNQYETTNQVRVAYGASGTNTWGNWCATCHGQMHSNQNYVHPVDQNLGSRVTANYNAYVKTGDLTGTSTNSFLSLVPFAKNSGDFATLAALANNNNSNLNGPNANDQVTCLSCHRAHASGWVNAIRWDAAATNLTENGVWPATKGRTEPETRRAYYDRPATVFATYQKSLCNKCHVQD